MDIEKIYGKRLKSDRPIKMFYRFPDSDTIQTLPVGKPSPVINSYLLSGFFEVVGDSTGNYYIKDSPDLLLVDENEPDESSFFEDVTFSLSDFWNSNSKKVSKYSGFLNEGFKDSVSDLKVDAFKLSKELKFWAVVIGSVFLISTIKNIVK